MKINHYVYQITVQCERAFLTRRRYGTKSWISLMLMLVFGSCLCIWFVLIVIWLMLIVIWLMLILIWLMLIQAYIPYLLRFQSCGFGICIFFPV